MSNRASAVSSAVTDPIYRSKFAAWHAIAWVKKPQTDYAVSDPGGRYFFSSHLVPVVDHPLVVRRGHKLRDDLLIQRFFAYAGFTATLERHAVNPATLLIAENALEIDLPEPMRADADRIYVDEGCHAQESNDITRAVQEATARRPVRVGTPAFLQKLQRRLDQLDSGDRALGLVTFAICSETLISSILTYIPEDATVVKGVRDYVAEHARDEGRHHVFFAALLEQLWQRLPCDKRLLVGQLMPEFVRVFLEPDLKPIETALAFNRFTHSEIDLILGESHPTSNADEQMRTTARHTVALCQRLGMLDVPVIADAFANSALI